jgi:hypothetical protein
MKEQFCTYEISLKLKELGFNEECFCFYTDSKQLRYNFILDSENPKLIPNSKINVLNYCAAPLWQQVIDWFREKHNKIITVYSNASGYLWETHDAIGGTQREWSDYSGPNDSGCWDTYEEAREQAILKALELISK